MKLSTQLIILFFLSVNSLYGQQVARVPKSTLGKHNKKIVRKPFAQKFILAQLDPKTFVIECFRSKFCTDITRSVSKEECVVHNQLFRISKYAAAKFSWDVISYAFVHAMKGKEIDEVWYPAFNQACTNVVQQKIAHGLCVVIPKNEKNKDRSEFVKSQIRSIMAMSIVYATKAYIFPVIQENSLALLKAMWAKK